MQKQYTNRLLCLRLYLNRLLRLTMIILYNFSTFNLLLSFVFTTYEVVNIAGSSKLSSEMQKFHKLPL